MWGDGFHKKFQIKKKVSHVNLLHLFILRYHCCINLKMQSEHSLLCPDTSSLVLVSRDHNFNVIALELVLTMEISMTNKNNEMRVYDAFAYFKHRIITDTSISWRCVLSKCNGCVRTSQDNITIRNDHSHFPDPADIEKRKLRTALKT